MVYYIDYIIYIIYSFLLLFFIYICLLIYKKYSFEIFNVGKGKGKGTGAGKGTGNGIVTSEKYSNKIKNANNKHRGYHTSLISNTSKKTKIQKIKSQYKIKSTEKTYDEIKFISQKPSYINLSTINYVGFIFSNIDGFEKIKNYNNDTLIHKITNIYIETKHEFTSQFVCAKTNKYFINNIDDFGLYHKNNLSNNLNTNILIKFCNKINLNDLSNSPEHKYIFVNLNKMIKIINNDEYDNICMMIEKNNGAFMLEDTMGNNIIGYGSYSQSRVNPSDIKKIFFLNVPDLETNKNYKLLCKYSSIKIYFYVCKLI